MKRCNAAQPLDASLLLIQMTDHKSSLFVFSKKRIRLQPDLYAVIKAKDLTLKLRPTDDCREWMQELEQF